MQAVHFRPRRLGHVNLWVSDIERSISFYESVCGIELVRRERALLMGFHSNGNTHHDVGMIEISRGEDRYGRNGMLQIPKTRGVAVGLNHLGWEMENEAQLVSAFRRARDSGYPILRALDHLISHSIYVADPDGNGHEFYADEMKDWRSIYNPSVEDEVTAPWDPLSAPPKEEKLYDDCPRIRRVERAPVHPRHLSGAHFATRHFDAMKDFFADVAGLTILEETRKPGRAARFGGTLGNPDITVEEVDGGGPVGLIGFRFLLDGPADLHGATERLKQSGVEARLLQDGTPRMCIKDPDGFRIEFLQHPHT